MLKIAPKLYGYMCTSWGPVTYLSLIAGVATTAMSQ